MASIELLGLQGSLRQRLIQSLGQKQTKESGQQAGAREYHKRRVERADGCVEHVDLWRPNAAQPRHRHTQTNACAAQRCRIQFGRVDHEGGLRGADRIFGQKVKGDGDTRQRVEIDWYQIDGH